MAPSAQDTDGQESDCGLSRADDKKIRNREASRRFREKKKACERKLAEENAVLKDEMEHLRKKLASTHVDAADAISDMHSAMRSAIEHLVRGLPDALAPNIEKALNAKAQAYTTVTQLIKDLPHIIPPSPTQRVMSNWIDLQKEGVEPKEGLLRDVFRMFKGKRFRQCPVSREQVQSILDWYVEAEPRYLKSLENKRRLRQLLEEASALAKEVEDDDRWFRTKARPPPPRPRSAPPPPRLVQSLTPGRAQVETHTLSNLRPEQIAARFAWFDSHMPALQDAIVGYRFSLASPHTTSPPAALPPASGSRAGSGPRPPAAVAAAAACASSRSSPAPAPAAEAVNAASALLPPVSSASSFDREPGLAYIKAVAAAAAAPGPAPAAALGLGRLRKRGAETPPAGRLTVPAPPLGYAAPGVGAGPRARCTDPLPGRLGGRAPRRRPLGPDLGPALPHAHAHAHAAVPPAGAGGAPHAHGLAHEGIPFLSNFYAMHPELPTLDAPGNFSLGIGGAGRNSHNDLSNALL
eukprot:tig00020554_g10947.t1